MGWMKDQAERLLRRYWKGPKGAQNLAEELHAIFNAEVPIRIDQPIILIGNDKGDPPLQIVTRPTDDGFVPPIVTGTAGSTVPSGKTPPDFTPFVPEDTPEDPEELPGSVPPPLALIGLVISQDNGVDYLCRLWSGPIQGDPYSVDVVSMLNLSADSKLPTDGTLYVQVIENYQGVFDSNGKLTQLLSFRWGFPAVFYGPSS